MLIRFGVSNHRSIRDYQELLLTASKRLWKAGGLTFPVPVLREDAVPVIGIYGANASGKSNLLHAMDAMRNQIVCSHRLYDVGETIRRRPFLLDEAWKNLPTRFDCTFTLTAGKGDVLEFGPDAVYEYGFEFNDEAFISEWLHRTVRRERRSTHILFERQEEEKPRFRFGRGLGGENELIGKLTRPNSLFLSAAAQNNHPILTPVFNHFQKHCLMKFPDNEVFLQFELAERLSDSRYRDSIAKLFAQADVGLTGLDVVPIKRSSRPSKADEEFPELTEYLLEEDRSRPRKRLQFLHSRTTGQPVPLNYEDESRGTQRLLLLLVPIYEALSTGSILIFDEMNASLHPRLQRAAISLFKQGESNPHGAQFVFSTHDVTPLKGELLRLDEIWFANKDRRGASTFTPLTDFRVRSRDDIEMAYRDGRLGGVPVADGFDLELENAEAD